MPPEFPTSTSSSNSAAASKTTSPNPSSTPIFHLPAEITQYILSFLDFPALENLRHTSHFSLTFPPPHLLCHAEATYRLALYEKEKKHARELEGEAYAFHRLQAYMLAAQGSATHWLNHLHEGPVTRAERLHCFTCYSYLDRDLFTRAQATGRRSYGHLEAMRRFCVACGFRERKWSHATYFRRGGTLPCVGCRRIAQTDREARKLDLCSECFKAHELHLRESEGESRRGSVEEMEATGRSAAGSAVRNTSSDMLHVRDSSCQRKAGDEMTKLSSKAASSSEETWIHLQSADDWTALPLYTATSERAARCIRCWMVDHTFRPALLFDRTADRLCEYCWVDRGIVRGAERKAPNLVPKTLKALP